MSMCEDRNSYNRYQLQLNYSTNIHKAESSSVICLRRVREDQIWHVARTGSILDSPVKH